MSDWIFAYTGFDPARQGLREALCTLGNGYFATRGAAEEAEADDVHYPGTYLAGCYNRLDTTVGDRVVVNEDLVNLPNWLCLNIRLEGRSVVRPVHGRDSGVPAGARPRERPAYAADSFSRPGRAHQLHSQPALVHMGQPHLAVLRWTLLARTGPETPPSGRPMNGAVINAGVPRYRQLNSKHLETLEKGCAERRNLPGGADQPVTHTLGAGGPYAALPAG